MTISAEEALKRLQEGNARFVAGVRSLEALTSHTRRTELLNGHSPVAIVLGCSDARVPAELVFDQGLGDLFVIRVAGNIVSPSQVGSVEFAAERFGTQLVVVLGHTQCGAVTATLEQIRQQTSDSPNLRSIVDRIRPIVETLIAEGRIVISQKILDGDEERIVRVGGRGDVAGEMALIQNAPRAATVRTTTE